MDDRENGDSCGGQAKWLDLSEIGPAVWMRLTSGGDLEGATAVV